MTKRFSQRKGYKPVRDTIQRESMDDALRNKLWNVITDFLLHKDNRTIYRDTYRNNRINLEDFYKIIWHSYFKYTFDENINNWRNARSFIRQYFFKCEWFEVYDFIEFLLNSYPNLSKIEDFRNICNETFKEEMSAYRIIGNQVVEITSEQEIAAIEESVQESPSPVAVHLQQALRHLSNRESPDYRNSIKESISAVEAICKMIVGDENATLGQSLKVLKSDDRFSNFNNMILLSNEKLYGYTNNAGIRHSIKNDSTPEPDATDAKFMLVSCSGFVNYLRVRASEAGITLNESDV